MEKGARGVACWFLIKLTILLAWFGGQLERWEENK